MFKIALLLLASAPFFASCGNGTAVTGAASNTTDTVGQPVETKPPNTTYKPAFAGQTRIGSVKTTTPYEGKIIDSSLNRPWGITALPDGRLLITQK